MFQAMLAIFLLIILMPIYIFIGLVIFFEDGSPVIFKQKRIGLNKRSFYMYKFRTMKNNTPDLATHLIKSKKYLLKSGNILRKTSLDEIPQLINIIMRDINFVGPRPALYNQHDLIKSRDKYGLNEIMPGITGWAQINGRDEISIKEKVKFDKEYLFKKSLLFDIFIIYKTLFKVLLSKDIK